MLGIIGAMTQEVAALKEAMSGVEIRTMAGMEFYRGTIDGKDVGVVRSGIGKVNAAVCCQILVDRYGADAIINTGIAGSLQAEINIGDIVLSTEALQHDMDATGFGYPISVIPQMPQSVFEADEKLRELAKNCCKAVNPEIQVFEGRVVSGDQFISDRAKKRWLADQFKGYCTEMEGAAIAQGAWLNGIPFLIVRAISDKADDSAAMDYQEFEKQAIRHLVRLVEEICRNYR